MSDYDDLDQPALGTCCYCQKRQATIVLMLDYKAPKNGSGTGWGCIVCGLPSDGAVTVLCSVCWTGSHHNPAFKAWLKKPLVCVGYPADDQRSRLADPEPFGHDMAKHEEEDRA